MKRSRVGTLVVTRAGKNCIYAPDMTVYFVVSPPKIPYIYRIFIGIHMARTVCINVWFWPTL
jgi:hypothetical protein